MAEPPGTLFLVVGPSGAGKDSLIRESRRRLSGEPRFRFARRVITRPAEAGGEAHEAVTPDEFARREAAGDFCLAWRAHGLAYGLPVELVGELESGRHVVANVSRAVIEQAQARFPRVRVLLVTASNETLRRRLAARGREAQEDVKHRLSRAGVELPAGCQVVTIRNDGPLEAAVERFLAALRSPSLPASAS